jgi:alpha-1,3-rhamnosyl/mannosyltransferase
MTHYLDVEVEGMKVILGIDSLSNPMTGIGRYTWELGKGLQRNAEVEELRFYSRLCFRKKLAYEEPGAAAAIIRRRNIFMCAARRAYRMLGPAIQALNFASYSGWLYHSTNFYLPNFPGKRVVTIHDLSIMRYPECHPADRVALLSKAIPRAVRDADLIITVSEFTKDEIVRSFDVSERKIEAIPLACADDFRPREAGSVAEILAEHRLVFGKYSLYVGTIEPRKNIARLIEAYASLPKSLKMERPLIMVGHPGWRSEPIHAAIRRAAEEGWLRYLGYVPEASLPAIFSGARCFLFPSLYEGFGLPVLEAMSSGVPVVTSPRSAMEEVAGRSVLYCDHDDCLDMARHIEALLTDDLLHERKRSEGLERARLYSWSRTVDMTVRAYCLALDNN